MFIHGNINELEMGNIVHMDMRRQIFAQKKTLSEMNNGNTITFGHEVPETTIKMIIQLLIIANVDKKMGKQLKNVIEYLYWTEDSSKHTLLH